MRLTGTLYLDGTSLYFAQGANYTQLTAGGPVSDITLTLPATTDTLVGRATTDTLTNKTLTSPAISSPTITGGLTISDAIFAIQDNSDATKQLKFQLSGITTSTTRTLTVPDTDDTLVTLAATQTLTNKTLTSPTITGATLTLTDSTFTLQDNSDATKQLQLQLSGITTGTTRTITVPDADTTMVGTGTTQTLTNKTLTSPAISGGTAQGITTLSVADEGAGNLQLSSFSSESLTSTRKLTFDTNDASRIFTIHANLTVNTGAVTLVGDAAGSSVTLPATGTVATLAGTETLTNKTITIADSALTIQDNSDSTKQLQFQLSGITTSTTRTLTVPDASTTLVGTDATQTLTNKTLTSPVLATPNIDNYVDFNEELASPSAPSSGKLRAYARDDGKLYTLNSDGVEQAVGAGSGEINYLEGGSSSNNWLRVGDFNLSDTTTASELPRENTNGTGIKITADADTQSSADYIYYDFDLDDVDLNRKLKLKWDQKPLGTYAAGQLEVFIAAQSDRTTALHTPLTSEIPAATGTFTTSFDTADTAALSLVIRCTEDMTEDDGIVISDVVVGPGIQPQGAVVTGVQAYTPTGSWVANTTYTGFWWREGENLRVKARAVVSGAPTAADLTFGLPSGLTIDTTKITGATTLFAPVLGSALITDAASRTYVGSAVYASTTTVSVSHTESGNSGIVNATNPITFASADQVSVDFTVPIAEWAGSGTLSILQDDTLTEWTAFTPSWGNINTLTFSTSEGFMRRVGDSMHIRAYLEVSGGTGAASSLVLTVPNSLTIDTDKIPGYDDLPSLTHIGSWAWYDDSGSATNLDDAHGWVAINSSTQILFRDPSNSGSLASDELATSDRVVVDAVVPILAWRGKSGGGPVGFAMVAQNSSGLVKSAGQLLGTNTNDAAATGYVGEHISSAVARGSPVTLVSGTYDDVTSITLSPGDWDISASVGIMGGLTADATFAIFGGIGTGSGTSATGLVSGDNTYGGVTPSTSSGDVLFSVPPWRVSISTTTTYYLKAYVQGYSAGTALAHGRISARRVR